jgi:Kelch motif
MWLEGCSARTQATQRTSIHGTKPRVRWTRLATLPEARHHIALSAAGGRIWGIGGFSEGFQCWRAQASVFWYEPAADRWHKRLDLPQARAEGAAAAVDGKVYVIGGRVGEVPGASHFNSHRDTAVTEVLDPASERWSGLPDAQRLATVPPPQ